MGWFPDLIGLLGVILILIAYYLLQANKYAPSDLGYLKLNIIGSGFMLYSLCFNWNLPAVIIEVMWLVISVWGIYKTIRKKESIAPA
jgi:hypothetical protein